MRALDAGPFTRCGGRESESTSGFNANWIRHRVHVANRSPKILHHTEIPGLCNTDRVVGDHASHKRERRPLPHYPPDTGSN